MLEFINNIDINIMNLIKEYTKNPIFDIIMPIITKLGNDGLIWIIICLILIISKKYRMAGIVSIISIFLTAILGEGILKNIFQRPRPFLMMIGIDLLIDKPLSYSFPSGHTAIAFAMAGTIARMIENKRIVLITIIFACLIAFSRLYLGVHYFSDILGGIILGLLSSTIVYKFYLSKVKLINKN